jgi:acyl-CoA synthetase (AMP-forming)/AMP-acid ligase II/acyl carrier protein
MAVHRGVVRLVRESGYARFGPEESALQLAPLSFDASTFEIWGALVNGGRLAIYPPGPVALRELAATLRRERVTTLFLTTGLFHQMVDEELASLAGLRQLVTGGDVISVARVRRVLETLPALRLVHAYGPTEATTFATCRTVTAADAARPALTLGRPIPRTGAHILDRGMEPVPPGVPGELWLGGDGLARGYQGQPEMTALRFAPSPFPAQETGGERLYRTGDLARWLPDGTVDFLGRIDRQVKIRGFRVEPAEVEAVLESHPGIAACVVLPRGEAEDKRLVAWVVSALSDAELLAWCRDRLPSFLVPAVFVHLDAVPLDLNGKVDRRALPEPDRSRRVDAYVAPRTPVEERVAAVWAEILGLDRVGAEDDFFLLGGHSLLATQIVSRLSRDFDVELSLRAFFEEPTVSGAALAITREQMRQGDPERMAVLLARVQGLSPEELADLLGESRD